MYNYIYSDAFLEHHGVKGMKWGVRRYQDYDGHLIGAKRRNKARTDLGRRLSQFRANIKKKASVNKAARQVKKQESLEEAKAKAIANGDIAAILKMRGSLTTAELRDAAQRQIAIKQLQDNQLPKGKSALEKVTAGLNRGKSAIDAVTGFHKSVSNLKEEFGFGKKKDDANQNGKEKGKKKSGFDTLADKIANKIKDAPSKSKEEGKSKDKKEKKVKDKKDSGTRILDDSYITNFVYNSRGATIDTINKMNESGWTAKNNGDWLNVLKTASALHVSEGNIWEERYGKN